MDPFGGPINQFDTDQNDVLDENEIATVESEFAFDGSDANADGILPLEEVSNYADERLDRQMGLGEFFDLIDTDGDDLVTAKEIEAAQVMG